MRAWLEGIGVIGPGLKGWLASQPVLAGTQPYRPEPVEVAPSDWLPPAERRRTGTSVRLALAVGREACEHSGRAPRSLASVFTSSGGDGDNLHAICETLASDQRDVSPTRFHNSVHNAPAGYWGVATGAMHSSTSLCAYDWSFAAGLIEAIAWVAIERQPVVLVAYDAPYPEPLRTVRPISAVFGVALVLAPERTDRSIATLDAAVGSSGSHTALPEGLAALCEGVPAARSLSLLCALARTASTDVEIEYLDGGSLRVSVGTP
jgi:hypothetical protein